MIRSVSGWITCEDVRVADAHCHLWITAAVPDSPQLGDETAAKAELLDFASKGGSLVLDCQPGSAGRNSNVLLRLARATSVKIVASTGFHLRRYYGTDLGPWSMDADGARRFFLQELCTSTVESASVRAGAVKAAWTGKGQDEIVLMEAAAHAAREVGVGLTVHTERGRSVERLVPLLDRWGMRPGKVQLSHLDKRPDRGLHAELARAGYVLGYDTFLRPNYAPEKNVWPLLDWMIDAGLWMKIAIGLDLVDCAMWRVKGGHGLRALALDIAGRLDRAGVDSEVVHALMAGNIVNLLSVDKPA